MVFSRSPCFVFCSYHLGLPRFHFALIIVSFHYHHFSNWCICCARDSSFSTLCADLIHNIWRHMLSFSLLVFCSFHLGLPSFQFASMVVLLHYHHFIKWVHLLCWVSFTLCADLLNHNIQGGTLPFSLLVLWSFHLGLPSFQFASIIASLHYVITSSTDPSFLPFFCQSKV